MDDLKLFDENGKQIKFEDIINVVSDKIIYLNSINRVEVIDENGRSYVNWKLNNKTQLSFQDNCSTLKIFVFGKDN